MKIQHYRTLAKTVFVITFVFLCLIMYNMVNRTVSPGLCAVWVIILSLGMSLSAVSMVTLREKKPRYIIKYIDPVSSGYYVFEWLNFSTKIKKLHYLNMGDAFKAATRYRSKWYAEMICRMLNRYSLRNLDLKKWYVVTVHDL